MGSLPCGGICPVELVCDLVSSHLAACNLHDPRTESMASSVHDTGSHLFFFCFVFCFVCLLFFFPETFPCFPHSGLLK